jgi:hypothetical protein
MGEREQGIPKGNHEATRFETAQRIQSQKIINIITSIMDTGVLSIEAKDYNDMELTCQPPHGCGEAFNWSPGEQAFMAQLHLAGRIETITKPKRCQPCRVEKRAYYEARESAANQ